MVAENRIGYGAQRNKNQHAHNSHHTAADGDGGQDPQRRQPHGVPHHVRIDQVPLHLLQNEEEHNKPERLHRFHRKNQKRTDDAADESAENRNQRRDGNEDADRQRIRETQNAHGQEKHAAEDHCLQALTRQKTREGAERQGTDLHDTIGVLLRQEGIEQLAELPAETLLLQQDIGRKNHGHDGPHHAPDNGGSNIQRGIEHPAHAVLGKIHQPLHNLLPIDGNAADFVHNFRILRHHGLGPFLRLLCKGGNPIHKALQRPANLRKDQEENDGQKSPQKHQRHNKADGTFGAAQAAGLPALRKLRKQAHFNLPHGHVDDKGNGRSRKKRRYHPQHHIQKIAYQIEML